MFASTTASAFHTTLSNSRVHHVQKHAINASAKTMFQERPLTTSQYNTVFSYSIQRAWERKSYRKRLEYTAELEGGVLRDFWDAKLCAELKKKGILTDPRSLAFNFSTDGMCLFRKGRQHTVHPLLLINYNLHPELRFEKRTSFAWESSQGPRSPRTYSPSCVPSSTNLRRSP